MEATAGSIPDPKGVSAGSDYRWPARGGMVPGMRRQLWLLPPPRPLVDRFGDTFFRELPIGPAVYLMCGATEGVLYVGKAKNLRNRLSSYRVANPERLPRRIIRLLHQVTRIEWDECPTETAARQREELLIAVLAPRFNRAGKVFERPTNLQASVTTRWRSAIHSRLLP